MDRRIHSSPVDRWNVNNSNMRYTYYTVILIVFVNVVAYNNDCCCNHPIKFIFWPKFYEYMTMSTTDIDRYVLLLILFMNIDLHTTPICRQSPRNLSIDCRRRRPLYDLHQQPQFHFHFQSVPGNCLILDDSPTKTFHDNLG